MLDKSIPYLDVLMHRKRGTPIPKFSLPEGFSFSDYKKGDEDAWAEIETSVLEFDSKEEALSYFKEDYLSMVSEVERRCLFIENSKGEKVATAMAWWAYSDIRRDPWVYWIAVKPDYQGFGLGKAVVSAILHRMLNIEGDRDFYLHTQTWSYKAITIYKKMGFYITDEKNLFVYSNNDYQKTIALLKTLGIE